MAKATTQRFDEMRLEVETDTPGTFARLCGMIDVTVTRKANMDTAEVPDCDDESLPLSTEKEVRSIEVMISATGSWAQESHETLEAWFYTSAVKTVRIGNLKAAVGDTEYETGPAYLTQLDNSRTKGKKVTAEISIEFDGTPTRTPKAA